MIHTAQQVFQALEAAREKYPDQADRLDFCRELLLVQKAVEHVLPALARPMTPERVEARRQAQQPLFTFDELEVEWPVAQLLLTRVGEVAAGRVPDWPTGVSGELTEETVRAWYSGQASMVPYVSFLIHRTLQPFLHRAAGAARPHLSSDGYWHWGHCPVCGGEPDFSTLERESGERHLFCSRCDTRWRYRRIGCPFCGTEDPRKLAYYPSDDGAHRLYVCDGCRSYLKTLDLREISRPFMLPVERLLTLGMDVAAVEAGYRLPRM